MSDKETICRVAFVNNNPDDKVFQPYPSGDYTAIKTVELADLKRQLAEAHDLVVAASRDCNATALERNKLRRQLAEAQAKLRTTCAAEGIEDPGCPMLEGG